MVGTHQVFYGFVCASLVDRFLSKYRSGETRAGVGSSRGTSALAAAHPRPSNQTWNLLVRNEWLHCIFHANIRKQFNRTLEAVSKGLTEWELQRFQSVSFD